MDMAASRWMKYDTSNTPSIVQALQPQPGEWCLWTMEIDGVRNYFSGRVFESGHRWWIGWDGFGTYPINDTLYFARVNPIPHSSATITSPL